MIEVRNLGMRHGPLEVLRGIDMSVPAGQVAVVIGPSGGGKSTFLRCINGLERFQDGSIAVAGHELRADDTANSRAASLQRIRRLVGMVFQGFHLFPHRTVLQNVTEAPICVLKQSRDEAECRAVALLERVGLSEKLHSRPRQLSGGQQQRVAIARALAMEPRAILFDEPTSALDPRMTAEVLSVIADLARGGQTMIVVTHAMSFARQVADCVHVFGDGKILETGTPSQIFDHPIHEAVREFLAETLAA